MRDATGPQRRPRGPWPAAAPWRRHPALREVAIVVASLAASPALAVAALPFGAMVFAIALPILLLVGMCAGPLLGESLTAKHRREILARDRACMGFEGTPPAEGGERRTPWLRQVPSEMIVVLLLGAVGAAVVVGVSRIAALAIFGIPVLASVLYLARVFWTGGIDVRWDARAVAPGRTFEVDFATTTGGAALADAWILLRCVRVGGETAATIRAHVVWESLLPPDPSRVPGPDEYVRVRFEVPPDVPATCAGTIHWEIVAGGRTNWGRIQERFLVYMPPAPPPEAPEVSASSLLP